MCIRSSAFPAASTGASTPTTRLGTNGVDPQNGGIVGTVSYDTTRNELDPRYAAVEDWQPSIPNLVVKLYQPVPAPTFPAYASPPWTPPAIPRENTRSTPTAPSLKGKLLNTYLSETWQRPTGCIARGVDGTPLIHGTDEQVLPHG